MMRRMRNPNELFVGDLSYFCREEHLIHLFSHFGNVVEARIKRSEKDGHSLMYGFVRMSSLPEALEASKQLSGFMYMGREMKVQLSMTNTYYDSSNKIKAGTQIHVTFFSFFPVDRILEPTEERIREVLNRYGNIVDIMVREYYVRPEEGRQEGFAFVTYATEESAMQAVESCNSLEVQGITYICALSLRNKLQAMQQQQQGGQGMEGHAQAMSAMGNGGGAANPQGRFFNGQQGASQGQFNPQQGYPLPPQQQYQPRPADYYAGRPPSALPVTGSMSSSRPTNSFYANQQHQQHQQQQQSYPDMNPHAPSFYPPQAQHQMQHQQQQQFRANAQPLPRGQHHQMLLQQQQQQQSAHPHMMYRDQQQHGQHGQHGAQHRSSPYAHQNPFTAPRSSYAQPSQQQAQQQLPPRPSHFSDNNNNLMMMNDLSSNFATSLEVHPFDDFTSQFNLSLNQLSRYASHENNHAMVSPDMYFANNSRTSSTASSNGSTDRSLSHFSQHSFNSNNGFNSGNSSSVSSVGQLEERSSFDLHNANSVHNGIAGLKALSSSGETKSTDVQEEDGYLASAFQDKMQFFLPNTESNDEVQHHLAMMAWE